MADADVEMAEPSTSSTSIKDKKRFEVKKVCFKIITFKCYFITMDIGK